MVIVLLTIHDFYWFKYCSTTFFIHWGRSSTDVARSTGFKPWWF